MFNMKEVIAHKTLPDMVAFVDYKNDNNLLTVSAHMFNTIINNLIQETHLHSSTLSLHQPHRIFGIIFSIYLSVTITNNSWIICKSEYSTDHCDIKNDH